MRKAKEQRKKAVGVVRMLALLLLLLPVSCINDKDDEQVATYSEGTVGVEMTIQTRAISSTSETYVVGSEWENYIDINDEDYRIYFFTYDPETETEAGKGTNSTLIAEFAPTDIFSTDTGVYATYYASGEVDASVTEYSDFKVVMLANWGTYPSVTPGTTTIDDICNAETAVFSAFVDESGNATLPSESLHIPFYGVHEYSGVTWKSGWRTNLSGAITLLRAVAKVEIVFVNDDAADETTFTDVMIHRYNATGYCAPAGVYVQDDYDHSGIWDNDFVSSLHLVNGTNDTDDIEGGKTISFVKTQERVVDETSGAVTQYEVWTAYVPEYDNMNANYSYMSLVCGAEYNVYFANYSSGKTTAYSEEEEEEDMPDRYDIYRNYLYRYNVSVNSLYLYVTIDVLPWVERLDNITFGGTTASEGTEGEDTNN